ncbi:MAG: hypothetical protein AAGA48_20190 [Myxococcota bacterium]
MKVCQTCGTTYKDYIDFCFNDGDILVAMADDAPITEVPHDSFAVTPHVPEEATEAAPRIADPAMAEIDQLPVDDEEPTQHSAPVVGLDGEEDDEDRTVPRMASESEAPLDAFAHVERTDPTESDTPLGNEPPVRQPTSPSQAQTEPFVRAVPAATAVATPDLGEDEEPLGLDDFGGDDPEEDTPVLQEPVVVAPPPSASTDYDTANTLVPSDSMVSSVDGPVIAMTKADADRILEDEEPAPLGTGPTLAPSPPSTPPAPPPPPVPNSLGQTLPLNDGRTPPRPLSRGGLISGAPDGVGGIETKPLPRPSATPTIPSVTNLRPGEEEEEDDDTAVSGTGFVVLMGGAFIAGVAVVAMAVGIAALQWLSSSDVPPQEQVGLPTPSPAEPLPPPPKIELGPEDDDFDDEDAAALIEPAGVRPSPGIPPGALPATAGNPGGGSARESKSISVVESLNRPSDGTGQRPILFDSVPSNALVELEGHAPFRTPSEVRLNVGERYSYTMTFPGYDPVKSDFMVIRGSGVLKRTEKLIRTPTTVPKREGPIVFGPQGCRLRVDGTLMESEDIVGGTKIDESTGRPMVYLPFQLKGAVLPAKGKTYTLQVVSGDGTPPTCSDYGTMVIEYSGQASIVIK